MADNFLWKKILSKDKPHRFARVPSEDLAAILLVHRDMTVEFDGVAHIQPLNLPGVAKVEPVVWLLVLKAVHNRLQAAQTVLASKYL